MSIRDIGRKFKHFLDDSSYKDASLVAIIILLALASFGLGRLSIQNEKVKEIRVGERELQTIPAAAYASIESKEESQDVSVVASKNSDVYHYPWCSGAQRIKERNKVYYSSTEEAKAAGLRPAKNCKGLE
ncbi:MAG: Ada metal-binding domain-containing protein [Candidatus Paceibacterota bacterium]